MRDASQAPFGRSVGVSPRCSIGFIVRVRRMELSGMCGWLIVPGALLGSHASALSCTVWEQQRSGPQTLDSLAAKLRWNPLFITMLPDSTLEVLRWVSPRAELCTLCPRGRVPETLTARWARGVQRRRPGERLSSSPGRG